MKCETVHDDLSEFPMWADYWDTGNCVRKVIDKEKDKVCFEIYFIFVINFDKFYFQSMVSSPSNDFDLYISD